MGEKIHVLADESLGGVKREYVEVERKAVVGDMVVCTGDCIQGGRHYRVGDVGKMLYKNDEYPSICVKFVGCQGGSLAVEESFVGNDAYLVLEPTDIVHIDEVSVSPRELQGNHYGQFKTEPKRFRLVDRKAEVGERVIVVNGTDNCPFENGHVSEVLGSHEECIIVKPAANLYHSEYCVIEPAETSPESIVDIIANLTRRMAELERREESQRRINGVLSQRINAMHRDIETWAQDHENLAFKVRIIDDLQDVNIDRINDIDDKVEMCIDDIVTLDERGQPKDITISVADLAKLIGGARG